MGECFGCKFKTGDFRHRIAFETPSETKDDTGAGVTTWATFATLWAALVVTAGSERLISQRIDSEDVYKFTIRYFPGISEKMRIPFNGKNLQIKSVIDPNGRREFLEIKALDEGNGT